MENKQEEYGMLKYETYYYLGVILLISGLVFLFLRLVSLPGWLEILVSIFIVISVLSFFIWISDSYFDHVLSNEQKEKAGFYLVRWKSKEFDQFVGSDIVDLYKDSCRIFELFEIDSLRTNDSYVSDYSFLLLPIAKSYEGILKRVLVEKGVISESKLLENPSVNVGAYLNPVGNEKIFNLLKDKARDKAIPHVIYSTYQECRNQILHYDQYRDNRITSFEDAKFYRRRILDAIDKAYQTFR